MTRSSKVIIFGSSGSVGKNALSVLRADRARFTVVGLCVNRNTVSLQKQIKEFAPRAVCVVDKKRGEALRKKLPRGIRLFTGKDGLEAFSALPSDISVMAIAGISCLKPLLINLAHTKRLALANKESIVVAGKFVFERARRYGTVIIPVDSEINALFQLFEMGKAFKRVYVTASGGALADYSQKKLANVTARTVLAHPTWKMGRRITVDSATLVNKAFEVIETHRFFNIPYERIQVLLHPTSTAHALVEYVDNALFACFYPPDMKMPIAHALYFPVRKSGLGGFDFRAQITFSLAKLSRNQYPLFDLVVRIARKDDNGTAVLNACDEVAVDYFLQEKIRFTDIHRVMKQVARSYPSHPLKCVDDVFRWDCWGRECTQQYLERIRKN